tara:strand:- start:679 stop:1152 length:474 start_codon:yes stop_codon:yes gene_type:complete
MIKKFLLTSLAIISLIGVIYPHKKENTELFNYCYSLERLITRNTIQKRKNLPIRLKSISNDIAKLGIGKTKGDLINKSIDQYKLSKNSFIINLFHNNIYCFSGYWIETVKPGIFESILYLRTKETIQEFKDLKNDVDHFFKDINLEYKILKKEFKSF